MPVSHLFPDLVDLVDEKTTAWGETKTVITKDVPCRIEHSNRLVLNAEGEQITSHALIFFNPSAVLDQTTKVRIAGDSYDHPIIQLDPVKSMKDPHHQEVYIR